MVLLLSLFSYMLNVCACLMKLLSIFLWRELLQKVIGSVSVGGLVFFFFCLLLVCSVAMAVGFYMAFTLILVACLITLCFCFLVISEPPRIHSLFLHFKDASFSFYFIIVASLYKQFVHITYWKKIVSPY